MTDWQEQALCRQLSDTAAFTADRPKPDELEDALEVCRHCAVRPECRAEGAAIRAWGIWGGSLLKDGKPVNAPPGRVA